MCYGKNKPIRAFEALIELAVRTAATSFRQAVQRHFHSAQSISSDRQIKRAHDVPGYRTRYEGFSSDSQAIATRKAFPHSGGTFQKDQLRTAKRLLQLDAGRNSIKKGSACTGISCSQFVSSAAVGVSNIRRHNQQKQSRVSTKGGVVCLCEVSTKGCQIAITEVITVVMR
jgi:hypothetical protein